MANLRNTNLNLLPILRELLRHLNVTHAAQALNMSQPATSEALARLRALFNDEILIPRGRTMVPSAFAERILPRLEATLGQIEDFVSPSRFDPATTEGALRIGVGDNLVVLLGAELVRRINQASDGLTVEFSHPDYNSIDRLNSGDVDLIISPRFLPGMKNEVLFFDEIVCLIDSRFHKTPLSPEIFTNSNLILYTPSAKYRTLVERYLQLSNINEYKPLRVQNFLLVPCLVEGSGNIGLMQRKLAVHLSPKWSFEIAEPPFSFPQPRYVMSWATAKDHDPAHTWLRSMIKDIVLENLTDHTENVQRE